jgi:hypothetical protein
MQVVTLTPHTTRSVSKVNMTGYIYTGTTNFVCGINPYTYCVEGDDDFVLMVCLQYEAWGHHVVLSDKETV